MRARCAHYQAVRTPPLTLHFTEEGNQRRFFPHAPIPSWSIWRLPIRLLMASMSSSSVACVGVVGCGR